HRSFTQLYSGHWREKSKGILAGVARRVRLISRLRDYKYIFLHREAMPLGPPVFEAAMFKLGCKVVYDFDDAIYTVPASKKSLLDRAKCTGKVRYITRRSWRVSVSTPYLHEWARQYYQDVYITPSTVNEEYFARRKLHRTAGRP